MGWWEAKGEKMKIKGIKNEGVIRTQELEGSIVIKGPRSCCRLESD